MSSEILAALIALVGVVVSVIVSLFINVRQTNAELQKLRSEIQQTYADKLLDKRLEVYPDMYFILSDFMKNIEDGIVTKTDVNELHQQTRDWNSRYSVFFSGDTGGISYRFRQMLSELIKMTDEEYRRKFEDPEALRELRHRVGEFELALKSDLGIYVVEFSDLTKRFKSYREISEAVGRKK
jgi:hypothetical protein